MSQGKSWNKDEVLLALEPYFKLGCNVTKACEYAGIPRTTVQTWIDEDEELRLKLTAWQSEISESARRNWRDKIEKGDYVASITWLSKKEKDEFSERIETTGKDGGAIEIESSDEIKKMAEQLNEINRNRTNGERGNGVISNPVDSEVQD